MTVVLIRRREDRDTGIWPCDDGDRGGVMQPDTKDHLRPVEPGGGRQDSPLEPPEFVPGGETEDGSG